MEKSPFLTHISELMYQRHYAQKTIEVTYIGFTVLSVFIKNVILHKWAIMR